MSGTIESSPQLYARMAGVSFLLGSLTSVFGQLIVRDRLVVFGDAAATAANIMAHESLFRFGFASSFIAVPFHIAWALLFYEMFKPVNRSLSLLAAFILLVGCATWALSSLFYIAPLVVLQGSSSSSAFSLEQLQALALMLLRLNRQAYDVGLVLFGLWYVLIGRLIFRSTFLPRTIGALVALAGVGYLTLLWRPLANYLNPYNLALAGPGEISLLLWLLVKGVNVHKWKEEASVRSVS